MEKAFDLRNARLGYGDRAVLEIADLSIPASGMVCLVGSSGVGKSTLLETLGLMSNTFMSTSNESTFKLGGQVYDPAELWSGPATELARLRRDLFSFIFQSTNLMPNFSIGENIRMANMGELGEQFDQRVLHLLDQMDLPVEILRRSAHELSGGQRQRIAFIRALAKDFSVLLADEPTGNLDDRNARALFGLLRSEVVRQGRTALVVTHHLHLAEEFGDMVLEIQPGTAGGPGTVMTRNERSLA